MKLSRKRHHNQDASPTAPHSPETDSPTANAGSFTELANQILIWGRQKAPATRRVWPSDEAPAREAPFEDKLAFYRGQHTTVGIRATHLVGIPGAASALPLLVFRPKVGVAVFAASWILQVAGHKVFEGNSPALTKGFFTYQFAGLAFWCEEMGDRANGR